MPPRTARYLSEDAFSISIIDEATVSAQTLDFIFATKDRCEIVLGLAIQKGRDEKEVWTRTETIEIAIGMIGLYIAGIALLGENNLVLGCISIIIAMSMTLLSVFHFLKLIQIGRKETITMDDLIERLRQ